MASFSNHTEHDVRIGSLFMKPLSIYYPMKFDDPLKNRMHDICILQ